MGVSYLYHSFKSTFRKRNWKRPQTNECPSTWLAEGEGLSLPAQINQERRMYLPLSHICDLIELAAIQVMGDVSFISCCLSVLSCTAGSADAISHLMPPLTLLCGYFGNCECLSTLM